MLSHYFKTALRYLSTHKVFTGINLFGLVTGISVCFFALQYVRFELGYDSYNQNRDRIFRLVTDVHTPSGTDYQSACAPLGPAVKAEFGEVRAATRFLLDYIIVEKDRELYSEENIAYTDSSLFSVFALPMVSGDIRTALNDPFRLILSESAARKYFGSANPMGRMLLINGKDTAYVTGVMKDMPFNSHFRVDMLVSLSTLTRAWNPGTEQNWGRSGFYTYVLLSQPSDAARLAAQLPAFVDRHYDQSIRKYSLALEPLTSVLAPSLPLTWFFADETYDAQYAPEQHFGRLFICFSVLAICLSCLGLFGLTVFNTLRRTKEMGMRKILGASVGGIIGLLAREFVLLVGVAFVIAVPVTAVGMHRWLVGFAYRIDLSWWMFALAGLVTMAIAMLTIGFQTVRAALANPIKNLRTE